MLVNAIITRIKKGGAIMKYTMTNLEQLNLIKRDQIVALSEIPIP